MLEKRHNDFTQILKIKECKGILQCEEDFKNLELNETIGLKLIHNFCFRIVSKGVK